MHHMGLDLKNNYRAPSDKLSQSQATNAETGHDKSAPAGQAMERLRRVLVSGSQATSRVDCGPIRGRRDPRRNRPRSISRWRYSSSMRSPAALRYWQLTLLGAGNAQSAGDLLQRTKHDFHFSQRYGTAATSSAPAGTACRRPWPLIYTFVVEPPRSAAQASHAKTLESRHYFFMIISDKFKRMAKLWCAPPLSVTSPHLHQTVGSTTLPSSINMPSKDGTTSAGRSRTSVR